MSTNTIELEAVATQDENGQGPPDDAGPPDHANAPDDAGPPDHAGPPVDDEDLEYAWVGVSPESIEGETNPDLSVVTDEAYTLEWTNTDDVFHNFAIVDDDGEEIIASDGISESGETETVEFTATEEMSTYLCEPHPEDMEGDIDVDAPEEAVFEVDNLELDETTVDQGESVDISATITNTGGIEVSQEISLLIGDDTVDSRELCLEAGEYDTVAFEDIDTSELDPGEHTVTVATEDDERSETLTVAEVDDEVLWHREHEWEADADAATDWDNYDVHDLGQEASGEAMAMEVDPDGQIWYIGRGADFVDHGNDVAEVCYVDPDTGEHEVALELDVIVGSEEVTGGNARELGGQSVAIDPDFQDNGYVYVYYHPSSEDYDLTDNPYHEDITTMLQRVSRFEMDGDSLDPESEEVIIEIPLQLETCCHIGGYLEFGPDGDLYITTGDDSNNVGAPDDEVNWSMTDEREGHVGGRPAAVSDAQRTSGNTADLRGSVLRITPTDDGDYEIPDGNLKEWWEDETDETYDDDEFLPELYVMGLRNPFTITVDEHTGFLFIGDYGNDATEWDPDLGTVGQATYHLFDKPGNAGHPFFKGYYPNRQYDFETGEPGQPFWFDNLRNRSRNNTGIENIPNVTPALAWHPQDFDTYEDVPPWADMPRPGETTWPQLDAGGSADAGVAYRYADEFGDGALDPYFEGKQFFMNPSNEDVIRYFTYNEDGSLEIDEFLPDNSIEGAYDMDLLPDGRLVTMGMYSGIHVVEYLGDSPEAEVPERVEPGEDGLSADPPGDATVLWNGDDATLEGWEHYPDGEDAEWVEHDDYFEVDLGTGDLRPQEAMGDVHLHLEWRVPEGLEGEGQGPGNSGVFMMETYEIQILQSYDNPTYPSGYAGSYYMAEEGGGSAPLDLPIRPPGEWQEFDIIWRGPRFEDGEVVRYPQTSVFFNGVAVQMHLDIPGPVWYDTLYDFDDDEFGHPQDEDGEFLEEVPFTLQDHGAEDDNVHFRNIWYRDLPERPVEDHEHPDEIPEYDTSGGGWEEPEQLDPGGFGTTDEPPEDADILIDDGITLESGEGDWESDDEYGDTQVHLEYRIPEDADGDGSQRGSSGVLMMGDYEINIVDTWENPVDPDEWAGAYTHQAPPHHDAVREPGEWQQLDLLWQSPRFEDGELEKSAQVTALLNGVAVQTRLQVDGPNGEGDIESYQAHGEQPLRLREDGSEVEFRNTWVRPQESDELEDGDEEDTVPDDAIEPGTAIEVDGQTAGWIGIEPEEIDGEENPTLTLAEGETYELGWTTGDGGSHNIEIRDGDGTIVDDLSTEMTSDPDEAQWLEFVATDEMAQYVCAPHEGLMSGDIDVV